MRRTGACFCCLAMVALIFAAAPAKAGDNSIDVGVILYDGVLTSDITAPLEVFGNAARKPWLQKINVEAVAADGDLDILTEEVIKLKVDRHRPVPQQHEEAFKAAFDLSGGLVGYWRLLRPGVRKILQSAEPFT